MLPPQSAQLKSGFFFSKEEKSLNESRPEERASVSAPLLMQRQSNNGIMDSFDTYAWKKCWGLVSFKTTGLGHRHSRDGCSSKQREPVTRRARWRRRSKLKKRQSLNKKTKQIKKWMNKKKHKNNWKREQFIGKIIRVEPKWKWKMFNFFVKILRR